MIGSRAEARTRLARASLSLGALIGGCSMMIASALAQPAIPREFEAPWTDTAPHREGENIVAAAVGVPDERLGPMPARRADARRRASERARAMLTRWLIADRGGSESERAEWIRQHATLSRVRPLSDGGAVVELAISIRAIEESE